MGNVVNDTNTEDLVFIGGRWMRDVDVTISRDTLEKMWQGYMCASCREPLREPFPEVCSLIGCGYRVRDNQRRDLERLYRGVDHEYNDLMRDDEPRIWVPKGVSG